MIHGQELYRAGIAYHSTGTIKSGRKVLAYYYKLSNGITTEQMAALRETIPQLTIGNYRKEYAPEITGKVLIVKSKAQIVREYKQIKREKITGNNTGNDVANNTVKTNHKRSAN